MARLIDTEHFEQILVDLIDHGDHKNAYVHHAYKMRNVAIKECRKMLWAEPTVDAVPVVRCKDCKWWDKVDNIDGVNYGTCERKCTAIRKDAFLNENWYCADGEKVTEF